MLAGLIVTRGEKRKLLAALRETARSIDSTELAAKTGLWIQNVYAAIRQLEREDLVESFAGAQLVKERGYRVRWFYRLTKKGLADA